MRLQAFSSVLVAAILATAAFAAEPGARIPAESANDLEVALSLATMLQSARQVIGARQDLINDPGLGDKGLTAQLVLEEAVANYIETGRADPRRPMDDDRLQRLLDAQMLAIAEVMSRNQQIINAKGLAFKGFVPAVFARMVNDSFREKVGDLAQVKVTAPISLVRNRRARPDAWENEVILRSLTAEGWRKGKVYAELTQVGGREAYRIAVPEYYRPACLSCHGQPMDEVDITGYPKEGGKLGDLGGVISITLFR